MAICVACSLLYFIFFLFSEEDQMGAFADADGPQRDRKKGGYREVVFYILDVLKLLPFSTFN